MTKCQFYRVETKVQRTNAHYPGAREFAPQRVAVAYCVHPVSVAPKDGAKVLNCRGDLAACLIADKL